MSSASSELELKSALLGTGLVQPIESSNKTGHIEILCRQVPGQESTWLGVLEALLRRADEVGMSVLLARRYVLRGGRLAFGWHIQVDAPSKLLSDAVTALAEVLATARPTLEAQVPAVRTSPERVVTPVAPDRQTPGQVMKVVRREVDEETGKLIIEEEMQLPHVGRGEMNKPSHSGGRGAKKTAGLGSSRPT